MVSDAHTAASSPFGPEPKGRVEAFAPPPGNGHTRLESWKEIGAFFDRDTRTVQLWEKKEGLPVYRHEHAGRPTVYAYRAELDTWLHARTHARTKGSDTARGAVPARRRNAAFPGRSWTLLLLVASITILGTALAMLEVRHRALERKERPVATGMVAVLPFEDRTPAQDAKPFTGPASYAADGLTDGLITDLGRSGLLRVISRRTVMQVQGQHASLPVIASQLHVAAVLEGEVARANGTVRVTARLVNALDDRQLWAETYRRSDRDVIAWQDDIAAQIAAAVTQTLTRDGQREARGEEP